MEIARELTQAPVETTKIMIDVASITINLMLTTRESSVMYVMANH